MNDSIGSYTAFHIGIDLARESDYSAASVIEKKTLIDGRNRPILTEYNVIMLKRWLRKTPYPAIVNDIANRLNAEPFTRFQDNRRGHTNSYQMPVFLAVDRTGIGTAVLDLIKENNFIENRCELRPIHISGGFRQHEHRDFNSIPKSDLIQNLVVAFQQKENLKIAATLPEAANLVIELENFEMSATRLGNDVFGARSGKHDDLVLSLALALWSAKNFDDYDDGGEALAMAMQWTGKGKYKQKRFRQFK